MPKKPGSLVVMYTDGVVEALDRNAPPRLEGGRLAHRPPDLVAHQGLGGSGQ